MLFLILFPFSPQPLSLVQLPGVFRTYMGVEEVVVVVVMVGGGGIHHQPLALGLRTTGYQQTV